MTPLLSWLRDDGIPHWQSDDGRVLLINHDALQVLPRMEKGSVDAILADPPYGIDHVTGSCVSEKWNVVTHAGVRIVNDDKPFDPGLLLALGVPYVLWGANFYSNRIPGCGWLVWDKRPGIEGMKFNRSDSELAACSTTLTVKTFRHLWHGLCRADEIGQHLHPTQKPVALMEWCLSFLPDAETILDPYMGSGTTGVACVRLGRRFCGVEIEPKYYEIARRRIAAEIELRDGRGPLYRDGPKKLIEER